jgi:hypothetical protein
MSECGVRRFERVVRAHNVSDIDEWELLKQSSLDSDTSTSQATKQHMMPVVESASRLLVGPARSLCGAAALAAPPNFSRLQHTSVYSGRQVRWFACRLGIVHGWRCR